ncbi:MAG: hypothetical protein ACT6QS_11820 [Flavobacteriales bacterium]
MKLNRIAGLALFFVPILLHSQSNTTIAVVTKTLSLPRQKVEVWIHTAPKDGPVFFNMHDDENTSTEAALALIADSGGTYIELKHSGARNISFRQRRKRYTFDPNRIYTDEGIRATLEKNGPYDEKAHRAVRRFSDNLLELVQRISPQYIFTLHNNTPENLMVYSFVPGREYEADASEVYADTTKDHDDFILVTKKLFFDYYRLSGYNCVLQNQRPTNDGSLSVWAALNRVPYINIEAEHGHVEEQKEMMRATYQMLQHPVFGIWLQPRK